MAVTFAAVATLASVGGGWAVQANQYGRIIALVVLAIFAVTLLSPRLAELISRPFVRLGNTLANTTIVPSLANSVGAAAATAGTTATAKPGRSVLQSVILGIATGLLWAPCAGPILGLILTGAAIGGAHIGSSILLLAYALGAGTSLAIVLTAGNKLFSKLKRSLGVEEWIRRILGVAVLAGVAVIAFGLDRGILTSISAASTTQLEQGLVDRLMPHKSFGGATGSANSNNVATAGNSPQLAGLPVESSFPSLSGATAWLNSPPLTPASLRGKVVLIDFWTYSCINCLRSLPYVKAWANAYTKDGLVVIGVHTPEFAFEKERPNVEKAIHDLGVTYPVAMDNDYTIWNAFGNEYWPAHYLIDIQGRIRYHHFGEGNYDETERAIQTLLKERNGGSVAGTINPALVASNIAASGVEQAADSSDMQTQETYLGFERAENFASGPVAKQRVRNYEIPATLALNHWALQGNWRIGGQQITLEPASSESETVGGSDNVVGRIALRFHARDAHIVLGPAPDGTPIRFRVMLDGAAPGPNAGVDVNAAGNGIVREQRLYQIIRQHGVVHDRTLIIEFFTPGLQAYSFTFG